MCELGGAIAYGNMCQLGSLTVVGAIAHGGICELGSLAVDGVVAHGDTWIYSAHDNFLRTEF